MTRFDAFMKKAGKKRSPDPESTPDTQASKHLDVQTSEHSSAQTSGAKSKNENYMRTTVYLTKALHKRLKIEALEHDDLDMSDIAEQAIAQWLDEHS